MFATTANRQQMAFLEPLPQTMRRNTCPIDNKLTFFCQLSDLATSRYHIRNIKIFLAHSIYFLVVVEVCTSGFFARNGVIGQSIEERCKEQFTTSFSSINIKSTFSSLFYFCC